MNKILTINLGGFPYTIDDDAYELLSRYLDSIRRHFRNNASYGEIISDIENRLAEIFSDKLGTRTIISMKDVEEAIATMGKPEEFAGDAAEATGSNPNANTAYDQFRREYRTGKRLFRDPDNKVFGGVCSGVSAYFGIDDPLWVRIGFAIAFFSFGVGFMVYLLLWIIVPEAYSSADRLAMRGEPINFENIARVVEEEVNTIGSRMGNAGSNNAYVSSGKAKGFMSNLFSFIGEIFYGIIKVIKTLFKPIFFLFGIIAFFILGALWIAFTIAAKEGYPFMNFAFGENSYMGTLGYINLFFLIGLALLGLGLLLANLFFKIKVSKYWGLGIGAFWLLNGISFGILGANFGSEFHREARVTQDVFSVSLPSDTIYVELEKDYRFTDIKTNFGPFKFDHQKLLNGFVKVDIVENTLNNDFRLVKEIESHGSSREEAEQLANQVEYKARLEGNRLYLPEYFTMENTKFRGQNVNLKLYVPNGKFVKLGKYTNDFTRFDFDDDKYDWWEKQDKVWKMDNGRMVSPQIEQEKNYTVSYEYKGFNKVEIDGYSNVIIKQGNEFDIKIIGEKDLVEKVTCEKTGTTVFIKTDNDNNDQNLKIQITTPRLDVIDLDDVREASLIGFSQEEMDLVMNGDFKIKADIDVRNLKIDATRSQVVLKGKGDKIEVILDDNAELNARQFEVKIANTSLRSNTEADIYATEKVTKRNNSGDLEVEGGATIVGGEKDKED